MKTLEIDAIRRDPESFVRELDAGEEFVVVDHERTIAEVHPAGQPPREPRPYGLCAGQFRAPDDFNDPLPNELMRDFGLFRRLP